MVIESLEETRIVPENAWEGSYTTVKEIKYVFYRVRKVLILRRRPREPGSMGSDS